MGTDRMTLCDTVRKYMVRWSPEEPQDVYAVAGYVRGKISLQQLASWDASFLWVNDVWSQRYNDQDGPPQNRLIQDLLQHHGFFTASYIALKTRLQEDVVHQALEDLVAARRVCRLDYGNDTRYIAFRRPDASINAPTPLEASVSSSDVDFDVPSLEHAVPMISTSAKTQLLPAVAPPAMAAATHIIPAVKVETPKPLYTRVLYWFTNLLNIYK